MVIESLMQSKSVPSFNVIVIHQLPTMGKAGVHFSLSVFKKESECQRLSEVPGSCGIRTFSRLVGERPVPRCVPPPKTRLSHLNLEDLRRFGSDTQN